MLLALLGKSRLGSLEDSVMTERTDILEFGLSKDGRAFWVTREGLVRSAVPGALAQTEARLGVEVVLAVWSKGELLYRTVDSIARWSPGSGSETILSHLSAPPIGSGLVLHPEEGFFSTTSPRRAYRYRSTKTVIFETETEIMSLQPCDTGDFISILCEDGLETFSSITGNSLGVMHDATGGWLLWDGLLVAQVNNPLGVGLMVVDLRASKLIQGGPSGYQPFEKFCLTSGGDWLIGVSPSQQLLVGWVLQEGCYPVPRWESRQAGMADALALPEDRILVLKSDGAPACILDQTGDAVRQLPLSFRGHGARLVNPHTLSAMDGDRLLRWNLQNGEGVAYA